MLELMAPASTDSHHYLEETYNDWLIRTGDCGAQLVSSRALGNPSLWSPALKAAVSGLLCNRMPAILLWGEKMFTLYNDAGISLMGDRHPASLGQEAKLALKGDWAALSPLISSARQRKIAEGLIRLGESKVLESEPEYYTLTAGPLISGENSVEGVLINVYGPSYLSATSQNRPNRELRADFNDGEKQSNLFLSVNGEAYGKILLIQKDEKVRSKLWSLLSPTFNLSVAPGTASALSLLTNGRFDLIIVDKDSPEIDGLTFIREQRKFDLPCTPIIVLSDDDSEDDRVRAFEAGADAYVPLSFNEREMVAHVECMLKLNQVRQASPIRMEQALKIARMVAWEWDLKRDYLHRSGEARNILGLKGYSPGDFLEIIHPDDSSVVRKTLLDALNRPTSGRLEFRILKEQKVVWLDEYYTSIADPSGNVIKIVGLSADITMRKEAELAYQEIEERNRILLEVSPQIVWMADSAGIVNYTNKWGTDYTGLSIEEINNNGWLKVVHTDDYEALVTAWKQTLATGMQFKVEIRLMEASSGKYRWHMGYGLPVRTKKGEIERWIGVAIDIDELKTAQEERSRLLKSEQMAREDAMRAMRLKDDFLATLSHELRTPLNAISGWAQIINRGKVSSSVFGQGIDAIERNARIQTQLISDLLDLSRITSGKLRLDLKRSKLLEAVKETADSFQPVAKEKNISLETRLYLDSDPYIIADKARLHQILSNLLSNSIKFSAPGSRVILSVDQRGSYVRISVRDFGQGIEKDFIPHIFDRFRQESPVTRRKKGGLGIGLSIVKQLVELHSGSIEVHSEGKGKGATFTVSLPVYIPASTDLLLGEEHEERGDPAGKSPAACLKGRTILVVDDDTDARDILNRILSDYEADVTTASSVKEAMKAIKHSKPDLLISDIGMPDENGYDLIKKIRNSQIKEIRSLPSIALTAYARSEDRKEALSSGFQAHLAKPVNPSELVKTVADYLSD